MRFGSAVSSVLVFSRRYVCIVFSVGLFGVQLAVALAAPGGWGAASSVAGGVVAAAGSAAMPTGEDDSAALVQQGPDDDREQQLLRRVRQLTFDGKRAGEGYFSADGNQLVFQSERVEGNPFYQIYVLDLTSGDTTRISPGVGKTTCAFFQPGTGNIMFSSTHHDPRSEELQRRELEMRAAGQERRYAWDYDPEMDIYLWDEDGGEMSRLTSARGYDAEGSFSLDGHWIVFASNRAAYERSLTPEEQRLLETDPAYFNDIYVKRVDSDQVWRLTDVPGYDGGPFFTPDGMRIVWRRFEENGLIADVWSMRPDGTDQRRLTDFDSMSWAPYTHPSGEYIFFASNKHGFENFEIFIVDYWGEKEPVRVTTTPGFDGLPVPSPDGETLVWTSNRHQPERSGDAQLFIADWDHDRALELLGASPRRRATTR